MRSKRKRHPITLLEIMIVILLIGIIGGVLSYNLKGTLDRGKKFRTEEGISRLKQILELEIEQESTTLSALFGDTTSVNSDATTISSCIEKSGFISQSNLNAFLKDGWGEPYLITLERKEIKIFSYRLNNLDRSTGKPLEKG